MSPDTSAQQLGILFLGGAKRLTLARHLIRAANLYGLKAVITSYELSKEEPIAAVADIVIGKRWKDEGVIADIERVVAEKNISVLLPFVDGAIEIAAKVAERNPWLYVPVCQRIMAKSLFDKTLAARVFEYYNLPIPATYHHDSDAPRYPLIAKPRYGSASAGIKILRDINDLRELSTTTDLSDYLIQDYIEGAEEFTIDCFVSADGRAEVFSPRMRLMTLGGEVLRTATVDIPELNAAAREVASCLKLTGAFTLQFLARDNRFLLMEINPRLGGGVTASIAAGADIPAMIIEEATGRPIIVRNARPDVVTTRCFQDVTFFNGTILSNP